MGKRGPTLAQRLLGRPSQKYTTPVPKQYYSERPAMMRIAASAAPPEPSIPASIQEEDDEDDDNDTFYTPRSSFASDTMTFTTSPTSEHGHAAYTDQDWANDLQWLAKAIQKPKRIPVLPQQPQRVSRPPTPSIMMSMSTLLEEDEDRVPRPPKHTPQSSVLISSRSSTPPPAAPHRRTRSLGTSASSHSSFHPPALPSGPPELPSYGTPAYTSLVIPPAPASTQSLVRNSSISQRLRAPFRRDTADLSRSRLAQATMASIEVVGGLASHSHHQPPRLGFTHYRTPPSVPKTCVLVQVWAVGLDAVDLRLLGVHSRARSEFRHSRTQSFGRFVGRTISRRTASDAGSVFEKDKDKDGKENGHSAPQVGFIPGRSFVGRVLECGWEVRDEVARRGEWVVGLLDIRKSGALAEFITVDRHRIHRVPYPNIVSHSLSDSSPPGSSPPSSTSSEAAYPHPRPRSQAPSHLNQDSPYPSRPSSVSFSLDTPPPSRPSSLQHQRLNSRRSAAPLVPPPPPGLDLAELALLPLVGIAAHRAVRTLGAVDPTNLNKWGLDAVTPDGEIADPMNNGSVKSAKSGKGKRRALVLHGHAGTGGLVACMLARRGWRVCVHAPGSVSASDDGEDTEKADREHMRRVQERARAWGVEEVVFDDGGCASDCAFDSWGGNGAAVRAVERLIADGDEFDAVVDTIGGKEVWDVGERLLARGRVRGRKQFTTTVGDWPIRPVPTAKDNFRAGLRSLKGGNGVSTTSGDGAKPAKKPTKKEKAGTTVSYAWVSAAQDVDWEGEDVRDSLGAVVRMTMEEGVRPVVEGAAVPFERACEVFEGREGNSSGVLKGGNVFVRVVG
ncbi:hypothetical protein B0H12DRAFT_1100067 [Mycena haematopus]|nr:hypothetical protein B0H12DRAFT_1100067 [Mycena haematopus]